MNQVVSQLIALSTRHSGSEICLQFAPKVAKHRKLREVEIADNGIVLPIKKVKVGVSKGVIGSYESKVNGQRLIEDQHDDFTPLSANGKEWIGGSLYHSPSGRYYIGYEPQKSSTKTIFVDAIGRQLSEIEKERFLLTSELPKAGGSDRQGVGERVLWVTASLDSLEWVAIGGRTILLGSALEAPLELKVAA